MSEHQFTIDHVRMGTASYQTTVDRFSKRGFAVRSPGLPEPAAYRVGRMPFPDGTAVEIMEYRHGFLFRRNRRLAYRPKEILRSSTSPDAAWRIRSFRYADRGTAGYKGLVLRVSAEQTDVEHAHDDLARRLRESGYLRLEAVPGANRAGIRGNAGVLVPVDQLALPVVLIEDGPPDRQSQPTGVKGIFRVELGAVDPSSLTTRLSSLTGISVKTIVENGTSFPTMTFGNAVIEIRTVDTFLEEGVLEVGLEAGFPGHNVLFDPDTNNSARMHVSYRGAGSTSTT